MGACKGTRFAALALLSVWLAMPACASLGAARQASSPAPVSQSSEECRYYDDAHLAWNAVATVGSALATGAATVLGIIGGIVSEEALPDWTIGLGITAAAGGLASTVASPLSGEYAQRYTERCSITIHTGDDPAEVARDLVVEAAAVEPEPVPAVEVEPPAVEPEPDVEPGPGETGTGSDGIADDATLAGGTP